VETRADMSTAWTGWVGFAAIMELIVGSITFFEGLVAVIRKEYFVLTPNQILIFDMKTWGWIMLLWGILLVLAGLGLAAKSGWARWVTIVLVAANLLAQLGWLGSSQYTLWTLTVITLEIIVIYALTARWSEVGMG
jgi:hypothetical protein